MPSKPILPLPGSNANEPGAPSPWPNTATSPDDVPGMPPRDKDPRSLSAGTNVQAPTDDSYPGAGMPGEPFKQAPAVTPRRLRRDG
jgi:hypothetical protein